MIHVSASSRTLLLWWSISARYGVGEEELIAILANLNKVLFYIQWQCVMSGPFSIWRKAWAPLALRHAVLLFSVGASLIWPLINTGLSGCHLVMSNTSKSQMEGSSLASFLTPEADHLRCRPSHLQCTEESNFGTAEQLRLHQCRWRIGCRQDLSREELGGSALQCHSRRPCGGNSIRLAGRTLALNVQL